MLTKYAELNKCLVEFSRIIDRRMKTFEKILIGVLLVVIVLLLFSFGNNEKKTAGDNESVNQVVDFETEETKIEPIITLIPTSNPVIGAVELTPTPTMGPTLIPTTIPTLVPTIVKITPTVEPTVMYPDELLTSVEAVEIYPGEKQKINVWVEPSNAVHRKITVTNSNKNVVKISGNVEIEGLIPGDVILTFKSENNLVAVVEVTVLENVLYPSGVSVNNTRASLYPGEQQQVIAKVEPDIVENETLTWSSSNNNVATVNENGLITAKNQGEVVITVTTFNKKTNMVKVIVNSPITPTPTQNTAPTKTPTPIKKTTPTPTRKTTPTPTQVLISNPIEAPAGANLVKTGRSDTLITSIEKTSDYYITRIWVKDPKTQIRKAVTAGWGKYFETVNTMADREVLTKGLQNKIMVAINASAWHTPDVDNVSGYAYTSYGTLAMVDGQILKNKFTDTSYRSHSYYVIDGNGDLKVFTDNKTNRSTLYQTIINAGVKNTFSFGLGEIVSGGVAKNVGGSATAKRQMFCQIDKNNFVILTISGSKTVYQGALILQSLGCKTGVNFDGGSSIRLVFKNAGESQVTTITGGARKVVDIFYVTE